LWQTLEHDNRDASFKKTNNLLYQCHDQIDVKYSQQQYLCLGGFSAFEKDLKQCTERYEAEAKDIELGPSKSAAEMQFQKNLIGPRREAILNGDKKMDEAEKKLEKEKAEKNEAQMQQKIADEARIAAEERARLKDEEHKKEIEEIVSKNEEENKKRKAEMEEQIQNLKQQMYQASRDGDQKRLMVLQQQDQKFRDLLQDQEQKRLMELKQQEQKYNNLLQQQMNSYRQQQQQIQNLEKKVKKGKCKTQ